MGLVKPGTASVDWGNITNNPNANIAQAFGAHNPPAQRSSGRKMSAEATVSQMVTSLPGYADGYIRAKLGGQTLKNELNYTASTWAEWAKSNAAGDATGLELTSPGSGISAYAYLATNLKPSTNYLILYTVVSNTMTSACYIGNTGSGHVFPTTNLPKTVGAQKIVATSQASFTLNRAQLSNTSSETAGNKLKIKEIRIFELPVGSQIESDATNLTADQLNAKYPYIAGGSVKSVQAQRIKAVGKNLFSPIRKTYGSYNNINVIGGDILKVISASTTELAYTGFLFKLKPNTVYRISASSSRSGTNGGGISVYDSTISTILTGNPNALNPNFSFTTDSSGIVVLIFYAKTSGSNLDYATFSNIQLEEGSLTTTYEPYTETVAYIPGPLRSLPNGVKDEVNMNTGQKMKNISDWYTLQASDITAIADNTNVQSITVQLPADVSQTGGLGKCLVPGYGEAVWPYDELDDVGKWYSALGTPSRTIYFLKALGTYANLDAAKAALAGTQIIYQLATPVPSTLKDLGQLDALPYGNIIIEPVLRGVKLPAFGTGKIPITTADAPILSIESVYRIDTGADGQQTKVDVTSSFSIDADKLGITYASADYTKPYEYTCLMDTSYSTVPSLTYSYPEADDLTLAIASHSYANAAADWVLTSTEAQCGYLICTLASGAANIIAPVKTGKLFTVQNDSGQTLTIKKSGGTGATVATGKVATFIYNGTDYKKISEI